MSAYVLVELQVIDAQAKAKYSSVAGATVRSYGGEFIAGGEWELLAGDPGLPVGIIIRFPDRQSAVNWYNSSEYQGIVAQRSEAMVCRFRLLS
ncbi:DUF1330 domain-containing protein [Pseudomonas sp. Je.1.5.c]|uniref:DUF1330 domain-containing protein n=1 Tax=Pseudomonas sp. Je.1.5.c TaxID=3142839 RepID=UPI003DA97CF8